MTQNLGNLVSSVIDAQRRVRDSTRQTPEWRSAQRAAVKARLEYWDAMGLAWDARHARRAPVGKPLVPAHLSPPEVDARLRSMVPGALSHPDRGGRVPSPGQFPVEASRGCMTSGVR